MIYWKTFKTDRHEIKVSNKGDVIVVKWNGKFPPENLIHIVNGRKRIGSHNYYNVYRLVDYVFRGPLPEGFHVHHINFDKTDDRLCNLQRIPAAEHHRLHAINNTKNKPKYYSIQHQKNLLKILQEYELDIQQLECIYEKYFVEI